MPTTLLFDRPVLTALPFALPVLTALPGVACRACRAAMVFVA
jgi:hypothetical protein